MPLPHSLFGSQLHANGKRHVWNRLKWPKLHRRPPVDAAPPTAPRADDPPHDAFVRNPPAPPRPANEVANTPTPEDLPIAPLIARGQRDPEAERATLQQFAHEGYGGAAAALQGAHPKVITHVADAACAAGAVGASRDLYKLAFGRRGNELSRVPKHLLRRIEQAELNGDAAVQKLYLEAWLDTQAQTFEALAQGCQLACKLNPALTLAWYKKAEVLANATHSQPAFEHLSRELLKALTYGILIKHLPVDVPLLQAIKTSDPQILEAAANAARGQGNEDLARTLEQRAQQLSAG